MVNNEHPTIIKWYMKKFEKESLPEAPATLDTNWLKNLALEAGAHDVGVIDIDRSQLAEERKDIVEIFPPTKSLLSLVVRLQRENIRCVSQSVSDLEFSQVFSEINAVARRIAVILTEKGVKAVHHSSGPPMDTERWPGKMWSIPHKIVAAEAGLGHIGHNRLLIHPKFGNFVILSTILLDREVTLYDQPLDYNPCLECKLCVAACPVGAIASDGYFNVANCMTHNYRDRFGGFLDWVNTSVTSRNARDYSKQFSDAETVSMWQALSYGICNKSSYCMAVCPAGEEVIGEYLPNKKEFVKQVVAPLQQKQETIFVLPGSDAEAYVKRKFPHKKIKRVNNSVIPNSVKDFLAGMSLAFQREQAEGLNATYHFHFTGDEKCDVTIIIRNKSLEIKEGHIGTPNIKITADAKTWIGVLSKKKNIVGALLQGKIRTKGSLKLMQAFGRCFPA